MREPRKNNTAKIERIEYHRGKKFTERKYRSSGGLPGVLSSVAIGVSV